MDYIRIKSTSRDSETQSLRDATSVSMSMSASASVSASVSTANDVKELLKDWIKLYPNSFAPDVDFKIYQLADGDIIIQLHEDLSSMAVALLLLYLESTSQQVDETTSIDSESQRRRDAKSVSELISQSSIANSQQPIAFITIDDTEVLLKQNVGKRALLFCETTSQQDNKSTRQQVNETTSRDTETQSQQPIANSQWPTTVRFLLDDNYVLDYDFERKPQPVKDSGLQFEELEFTLPEVCETVVVGDVVKKEIDKVLESEGLTPKKMLIYLLCGAIGLSIGFLIIYFSGKLC